MIRKAASCAANNLMLTASLSTGQALLNLTYVLLLHISLLFVVIAFAHLPAFSLMYLILPIICVVHQRLVSEWIHEASHFNLYNDKKINDFLSDLLLGFIFATPIKSYRVNHLKHHITKDYFSNEDIELRVLHFESGKSLCIALIKDLLCLNALNMFIRSKNYGKELGLEVAKLILLVRKYRVVILSQTTLLVLVVLSNQLPLLCIYYFTLLSIYPMVNRIRTYGQHVCLFAPRGFCLAGSQVSRTIFASRIEQVLICSPVIMFHHEHHLYPSLPYRTLRKIAVHSGDPNKHCNSNFEVVWRMLRDIKWRA